LLEIVHWGVTSESSLRARFRERRGATSGADASGVWRYRELVLPSAKSD
jgi:hypothetical protein